METSGASRPIARLTCENEQIQHLNAVQPSGFLISVAKDWTVLRASENVEAFLGVALDHVLGSPVRHLIDGDLVHDIRGCLQSANVLGRVFRRRLVPDGGFFDIAAHRSGDEFILDFEPSVGAGGGLADLSAMIHGVERQGSAGNLLKAATRRMRDYTGYDRVMVYRFDEDGAGEVVAESAQEGMEPYLGLRYPASDIPAQARALYERSYLRSISDVDAAPVAVAVAVASGAAAGAHALDLSMSVLRSVSPIHLEYLRNMGVRASMSVSILRGGRLWGLFACHHRQPRRVGYETLSTVEMFAHMFSHLLEEHEREDDAVFDALVPEMRDKLVGAAAGSMLDRLPALLVTLGELIPYDGIAVIAGGDATLAGRTPTRAEVLALTPFLAQGDRLVSSSNALGTLFAPATAYADRCAGLLALRISGEPRGYVLLFRREVLETIVWAGEPTKEVVGGPDGMRLSPRRSFAAWSEEVRGRSSRWTRSELRAAEAVRTMLVEVSLEASDQAHVARTGDGRRQEIVIAELNHRVRNILGLVRGLVAQSAASTSDVRVLVDSLDARIRSLASAHDILTDGDWKPSSLHALLRAEIGTFTRAEENLVLVGPDLMLQPRAYAAMAMVIHELVTNARKHGALTSPTGRVAVATTSREDGGVAMGWHEAGGPPVRSPKRRGFGTTILEQAVPFECDGTCASTYHVDGFRWEMTLPAGVAACTLDDVAPTPERERHAVDDTELVAILRQTLVVEDNLFIAFDAEDIMRTLGAGTIEVVKSVAAALDAIAQRRFTFALLDVNLGVQTSLPVALALREAKIPFIFATGYRQALGMPASLADVAIVSKPYNRHAVGAMLMRLLPDRLDAPAARAQPQHASPITTFREIAAPVPRQAASSPDVVRQRQPDAFSRRLAGLAVLSSDDEAAIAEVSSQARAIARKTDIVRAGARPDGLYVVLAGFACRFRLRGDGSRQITSYLLPGDALDLSDVPETMTDDVGTLSDCRVATLSYAAVATLKARHPRIAAALISSAHVDQAVAREWLVSVGRRSAEERFAHLFCELLVRLKDVGLVEHDAFVMPLTQFDLADTLGLSVVHVNRTLQMLRQRGLFVWKGKVVTILDRPGLLKLADFDPRYLRIRPDVTGAPARAA